MARKKSLLEQSSHETQHIFRWLISSKEVELGALYEQARQDAIEEFRERGKEPTESSIVLQLMKILEDVVAKHLGISSKDDQHYGDLFENKLWFNIDWDPEVDSLIGGLARLNFGNVASEFYTIAKEIDNRLKPHDEPDSHGSNTKSPPTRKRRAAKKH